MKQVLFIGEYDKTDMMFYLSKLISMEHSVLLVDVTQNRDMNTATPR
ncbi:hypothetical protein [Paenibacillus sp. Y412MC10]|nr:hypothetical protein [Paenibacillus sp. Y412MC10]